VYSKRGRGERLQRDCTGLDQGLQHEYDDGNAYAEDSAAEKMTMTMMMTMTIPLTLARSPRTSATASKRDRILWPLCRVLASSPPSFITPAALFAAKEGEEKNQPHIAKDILMWRK
jgi:hypothetical protein